MVSVRILLVASQHSLGDLLSIEHANAPADEADGLKLGPEAVALRFRELLGVIESHCTELVLVLDRAKG